jgi:small neutral amino acid transporter SnatA (MarC family)
MRTDGATTIVTRMLLVFGLVEFAVGTTLLVFGLIHHDGLLIGGGCVLFAIAARTWVRRRSALRLTRMARPD